MPEPSYAEKMRAMAVRAQDYLNKSKVGQWADKQRDMGLSDERRKPLLVATQRVAGVGNSQSPEVMQAIRNAANKLAEARAPVSQSERSDRELQELRNRKDAYGGLVQEGEFSDLRKQLADHSLSASYGPPKPNGTDGLQQRVKDRSVPMLDQEHVLRAIANASAGPSKVEIGHSETVYPTLEEHAAAMRHEQDLRKGTTVAIGPATMEGPDYSRGVDIGESVAEPHVEFGRPLQKDPSSEQLRLAAIRAYQRK